MLGENSTREITITYCAADEFTSSAWNEKEFATEEANRDAVSHLHRKSRVKISYHGLQAQPLITIHFSLISQVVQIRFMVM